MAFEIVNSENAKYFSNPFNDWTNPLSSYENRHYRLGKTISRKMKIQRVVQNTEQKKNKIIYLIANFTIYYEGFFLILTTPSSHPT